jgi:anaerobic selenocysteine-containing dehydrogenase
VFAVSEYAESWQSVRHPGQRINLHIPELMPELASLEAGQPRGDTEYPFVLSAGERRSDTSNTSIRDPAWHRKGPFGTLRINPQDASNLGCADGDWVRITTRRGSADAPVEISSDLQPGHVSLPNGHGIDYHQADGMLDRRGVALNELTSVEDRDQIAGTPWHKHVAARLESLRAG